MQGDKEGEKDYLNNWKWYCIDNLQGPEALRASDQGVQGSIMMGIMRHCLDSRPVYGLRELLPSSLSVLLTAQLLPVPIYFSDTSS